MPISDIWTLEPDGSPEEAATLSSLGFASASLNRASLVPATLDLTMPRGDAVTMDLSTWAWASAWVLRRDGEVEFRGYVSTVPRRSGNAAGEAMTLTLSDALWKLDRTHYTQEWTHAAGAELQATRTARARLCWNAATGDRETTKQALAAVLAAATVGGVTVALDDAELPDLTPPAIEGTQKMCGELIRDLMRWHPDCSASIVSTDEGDTLVISRGSTATPVVIAITDEKLDGLEIARRDDLVVDSVHVSYEAEIPRSSTIAGGEGESSTIRTRDRLALYEDIYPEAAAFTWRSMPVVIPVPGSGGGRPIPAAPAQPHKVAIRTRPLPEAGAYDAEAEKFWLWALDLKAFGLTADDIKLPTTTVGDILAHTVAFANEEDDPNDPLFEMPSAINPASTVLYRPTELTDLTHYLVAGQIAEWMNVRAAEVRCQASVHVRKSTVDALEPRLRKLFKAKNPREGTVSGIAAYILDAQAVVMGTDTGSRIFKDWPANGTGDVAADNAAASSEAEADVVIPGLAQALYTARSTAPWEGSINLTEEEAGTARYLGKVIRLSHADRPEWSTMRALVQSESLSLVDGSTTLTLGLPQHLEPSDFIAIAQAAREASRGGSTPPIPPTAGEEAGTDPDDDRGGVFPGTVTAVLRPNITGLTDDSRQWKIRVIDVEGTPTAQIRSGTLTGLGLSGYMGAWVADTWNNITLDRNVWLKLTYSVTGTAHTYYSAPEVVETIYIPSSVSSASAELHYTTIGGADPTPVAPTIDPGTGAPDTAGIEYFRIGSSDETDYSNDYIGPLLVGWCPPESPWLVQGT